LTSVRTTRLLAAVVSAAVLLTAACGGDDDDGQAGDNAGKAALGTTTTTEEASTTTSTTTESTTTSTTGEASELAEGPNYVSSGGPSGAGCTPGERDTLPDGWWAGEVTSVQEVSIDFDLICFFTGDAAVEAADEDGAEVTNDYYVRNNNERTFRVEFPSGTTPATCVSSDATTFPCQVDDVLTLYRTTDVTATTIVDGRSMLPYPLVWVHVTGGSGDYFYMQYTP
jgi:hypothetical protein